MCTHAGDALRLQLPEVPNVWDQMHAIGAIGDGMSPADSVTLDPEPEDSVEYMRDGADEGSSLASDAMLLILHAIQARSQGRSLADDRRANAEQYWRQAEEEGEAGFIRSSSDF